MATMVLPYFMCVHNPFSNKVAKKETLDAEVSRQGIRIISSSVRKGTYRAKISVGGGNPQVIIAHLSEQQASWQKNPDLVVDFEGSIIKSL